MHSEDADPIPRKDRGLKGIDPKYLPFIDTEIETNNTARGIIRALRQYFPQDSLDCFPTMKQLNNRLYNSPRFINTFPNWLLINRNLFFYFRKAHTQRKQEGPLTQYASVHNLKRWYEEHKMKNEVQYQLIGDHDFFTMGFVEYMKQLSTGGEEPAVAFVFTTKG